jgi:hypothetical protein
VHQSESERDRLRVVHGPGPKSGGRPALRCLHWGGSPSHVESDSDTPGPARSATGKKKIVREWRIRTPDFGADIIKGLGQLGVRRPERKLSATRVPLVGDSPTCIMDVKSTTYQFFEAFSNLVTTQSSSRSDLLARTGKCSIYALLSQIVPEVRTVSYSYI